MPDPKKLRRVQHHPALSHADLPAFMTCLRSQQGVAAAALEFTILTATRTAEALGARWGEFDFSARSWTVPSDRMKMRVEHRVPLSPQAIEILDSMRQYGETDFVFPGGRVNRPLSTMAMLMTLRRMERSDITVHGFRSTFRGWSSECTNAANEVCEMALAHTIRNAAEAAYRRGDLFDKRRMLMNEWARYCGGQTGTGRKTVSLPGRRAA